MTPVCVVTTSAASEQQRALREPSKMHANGAGQRQNNPSVHRARRRATSRQCRVQLLQSRRDRTHESTPELIYAHRLIKLLACRLPDPGRSTSATRPITRPSVAKRPLSHRRARRPTRECQCSGLSNVRRGTSDSSWPPDHRSRASSPSMSRAWILTTSSARRLDMRAPPNRRV